MGSEYKWYPYNKGGTSREWYGNRELVVEFKQGGKAIEKNAEKTGCFFFLGAQDVFFKEGITWNGLSSKKNTFRYSPKGTLFDSNKGPMLFCKDKDELYYLLALFNSKVTQRFLDILNPSISLQAGDFEKMPIIIANDKKFEIIEKSKENIELSKLDWDMHEISSDFAMHPLIEKRKITYSNKIEDIEKKWIEECQERNQKVKNNEELLNEKFISVYKLNNKLDKFVEDSDLTLTVVDIKRDIQALVSYVVGCMFGRYSLDEEGLIYAGGEWDGDRYKSFIPDEDNCIPITDEEYFSDDIVGRFVEFVKTVYGVLQKTWN